MKTVVEIVDDVCRTGTKKRNNNDKEQARLLDIELEQRLKQARKSSF